MTDMEETKSKEIPELQEMSLDIQLQVEEAKAMVIREHEAAQKSVEEASTQRVEEAKVSVIEEFEAAQKAPEEASTHQIEFTAETLLLKKEEAIIVARKAYDDAQERSNEVLKKVEDGKVKLEPLQDVNTVRRMVKLQKMLHEMQLQVRETMSVAIKEEISRKANEEASAQNIELTVEIERLKALLLTKEEAIYAANKAHTEAEKRNNELLKKVQVFETKAEQLQDTVQRLEEKVAKLESENHVLRQQADANSQTSRSFFFKRSKTTVIQRALENGNSLNGETRLALDMTPLSDTKELEVEEKPQKSPNEKQQELLIKSISQDLGFADGQPIAACLIYKCLLRWRSFEVESTNIFDHIIEAIGAAIEVQDNTNTLSYWLSNSCTLLLLLQQTVKATGAASWTPQMWRTPSSLFGRMSQGVLSSPQSAGLPFLNSRLNGGLNELRQVGAKHPALLFKQQLNAFLGKIYGMIRDNLKKEISPLLNLCIQAPRVSHASLATQSSAQANAMAEQDLIAHWQSLVKILTDYLNTLKANHVPPFLVHKVFKQTFSFINVQLFNSLLLRRECCTFSNGVYLKAGLSELEQWCYTASEEYAGSSWDELKHIRPAVGFLVIHQKPEKTLKEITNELCPGLSIQQLHRISTMYWDDKYGTLTVSSEVISSMRVMMAEDSKSAVSSSFLLDADDSIPFSLNDIANSISEIEVPDIVLPPLLRQNSEFAFLSQSKQ